MTVHVTVYAVRSGVSLKVETSGEPASGYTVGNIDCTICAEKPKLNPHVEAMRACLAEVMNTDPDNISIKATTTEKLGFTGRQEGISAYCVALISK